MAQSEEEEKQTVGTVVSLGAVCCLVIKEKAPLLYAELWTYLKPLWPVKGEAKITAQFFYLHFE